MISQERRHELCDGIQDYLWNLRADTKDMTNEERVFFLDGLSEAIKAASDKFKTGNPEDK